MQLTPVTSTTSNSRMTDSLNSNYDVIVIGGGPAGATCGTLLSEFGHRTLILERTSFPRFHVGESLIPETYWTLERLGLIEKLKASSFPKKYSVQFFAETGKPSAPFYFDDYIPADSSRTWQVWRGDFDEMLLNNAAQKGATVVTEAQVLDVLFDNDRAVGVKVKTPAGEQTIASRVIVDATGQSAFLATRLGLKQPDPKLKKGAIWTYFKHARRDPGRDEGATLILQTREKNSWFWFIPLTEEITSIGVTGDMDYLFSGDRGKPEETFAQEVERCNPLQERLVNATRVRDFFTTKDFSYQTTKAAGSGWVLIGDAFGFIDPIYSTGVFLALKSGEFAADAIHSAFDSNNFSAEQLGGWQAEHRRGIDLFRKLVYAFYTPEFSFGMFFRQFPQYRNNMTDLLMGNVFKPGVDEMFQHMPLEIGGEK